MIGNAANLSNGIMRALSRESAGLVVGVFFLGLAFGGFGWECVNDRFANILPECVNCDIQSVGQFQRVVVRRLPTIFPSVDVGLTETRYSRKLRLLGKPAIQADFSKTFAVPAFHGHLAWIKRNVTPLGNRWQFSPLEKNIPKGIDTGYT